MEPWVNLAGHYALNQRRAGVVFSSLRIFAGLEWPVNTLTIAGEPGRFTFSVLEQLSRLGYPWSILTAGTPEEYAGLLERSGSSRSVALDSIFIHDFVSGVAGETETDIQRLEAVKTSEALFLNVHGDILCAGIGCAVLCGKGADTVPNAGAVGEEAGLEPACSSSDQCFRRNRFLDQGLFQHVYFNQITASVVFLNTCGGLAFRDGKYPGYPFIMPLSAVRNKVSVYISSFLIKNSSVQELYLFRGLVSHYKSFSVALYMLNRLLESYTGKAPVLAMLGDGTAEVAPVSVSSPRLFSVRVKATLSGSLRIHFSRLVSTSLVFTLDPGRYPLKDVVRDPVIFVADPAPCSVGCFVSPGDSALTLVVQFHYQHPEKFSLYLVSREVMRERSRIALTLTERFSSHRVFMMESAYRERLQAMEAEAEQIGHAIREIDGMGDLDGRKYFFLHTALERWREMFAAFDRLMAEAILDRSLKSDTHLVCAEGEVQVERELYSAGAGCPYCGASLYAVDVRDSRRRASVWRQDICPHCEIIAVRERDAELIRLETPPRLKRGEAALIRVKGVMACSGDAPIRAGVALINGKAAAELEFTRLGEELEGAVELTPPGELQPGLYYWRCVVARQGVVTIGHRQVFII